MGHTVNQWQVRIIELCLIRLIRYAVHTRVRVIAWASNHRQNTAITRVHHHHGGALPFQQFLNILLERKIYRQIDILSGLRRGFGELANHAAMANPLNFLRSSGAVQLCLVITIDPLLADVMIVRIDFTLTGLIQAFGIAVVNL